jgi:hypothetical protein
MLVFQVKNLAVFHKPRVVPEELIGKNNRGCLHVRVHSNIDVEPMEREAYLSVTLI